MAKKPIQVVYNNKPDPVVKITEYEYTGDGLKKVAERVDFSENTYDDKTGYLTMNDPVINPGTTLYPYTKKDKPEEGKTYALTGTKNDKCILNGNTWKESEVK